MAYALTVVYLLYFSLPIAVCQKFPQPNISDVRYTVMTSHLMYNPVFMYIHTYVAM